jgi:myxalamid-type polyketide synthase MxaE and MxaD
VRDACARAGVEPARVQLVEAHGTGTALGDPIEVEALAAVLGPGRDPGCPCRIGSVKTNIGHLEAAAGIAGVIKVALALYHKEIPPSLHFEKANPHIPFEALPVQVQTHLTAWPAGPGPGLAGVSSFGFGGTNAHAVLEEAPAAAELPRAAAEENWPLLLPLSARAPQALGSLARSYADLLATGPATFADVAHSACVRREHHDHRLAVVAGSAGEARQHLEAFRAGQASAEVAAGQRMPGRRSRLAFVFCGQGPQWWAMGQELLRDEAVFRDCLERIDALLKPLARWSLLDELSRNQADTRLDRTEVAQPALFALQVALAELWRSWGIVPHAVLGHSLGEVAAAHVAGALSLEDAVRVVFHRGRLMQQAAGKGRTAAVEGPAEDTLRALAGWEGRVGLAAVNSPLAVTLSGDEAALAEVLQKLRDRGAVTTLLRTDCAFHSHHMDLLLPELTAALRGIQPEPVAVPMMSTVTGRPVTGTELDAAYWAQNVRQPVRFADAVRVLLDKHHDVFLEVGPHPILARALSQTASGPYKEVTVLKSLDRREPQRRALLRSLGTLYVRGYPVSWSKVNPGGRYVPLPSYPWQRQRYWLETGPQQSPAATAGQPPTGRHVRLAHPAGHHVWETEWDGGRVSHRGASEAATACVEMALAAAEAALGPGECELTDVEFPASAGLPQGGAGAVQVVLAPAAAGEMCFEVFCRPARSGSDAAWTLSASGRIRHAAATGVFEPRG